MPHPFTELGENMIFRETLVSCAINAVLSFAFFFLVFRGNDAIALGEGAKFAFDFLPQALAVGFFAAFPPVLIMNQRVRKGRVEGQARSILSIFLRALGFAVVSVIIFGVGGLLVVQALDGALSFSTAALIKIATGIVISAIITPIALRAVV